MKNNEQEIERLLNYILEKLEEIELKIEKQEQEIKGYLGNKNSMYDLRDLLLAQQRSTRTSLELLREEVEEMYQIIRLILAQ